MRCSRTNNHTTREAACTCIAELASKIDAEAVRPHAPVMLRTLITCLRDDSWPVSHPTPKDQQFQVTNPCDSGLHLASHLSWRPATGSQKAHKCRLRDSCCMQVRDAALLASGKCAASFPEECRASLPELYKLWTRHLDDNIPSVRADAAAALGDALQAYKQELLEQLLPLIRQELLALYMLPLNSPCVIKPSHTHRRILLMMVQVIMPVRHSSCQEGPKCHWGCPGMCSLVRRIMLPRAREQHTSSVSNKPGEGVQLPTAMPGSLPGTRVVSAEQSQPDQGGLFKDTGLVQSKDTGGVGVTQHHLHPRVASLLHIENSPRTDICHACTGNFVSC